MKKKKAFPSSNQKLDTLQEESKNKMKALEDRHYELLESVSKLEKQRSAIESQIISVEKRKAKSQSELSEIKSEIILDSKKKKEFEAMLDSKHSEVQKKIDALRAQEIHTKKQVENLKLQG